MFSGRPLLLNIPNLMIIKSVKSYFHERRVEDIDVN